MRFRFSLRLFLIAFTLIAILFGGAKIPDFKSKN
jgi:hypothetical protein